MINLKDKVTSICAMFGQLMNKLNSTDQNTWNFEKKAA